jgi:hypothetical protein
MVGRYSHADQFKRARRALKFLRTRLGRRDMGRNIAGDSALKERLGPLLALAVRVRFQEARQRGPEVYSLHAPEVKCIGKGKPRAPYEFRCKVSLITPAAHPRAEFVLHGKALHGNPYDGPHPRPRYRRAAKAHRRRGPPRPCRQGIPRPQSPNVNGTAAASFGSCANLVARAVAAATQDSRTRIAGALVALVAALPGDPARDKPRHP